MATIAGGEAERIEAHAAGEADHLEQLSHLVFGDELERIGALAQPDDIRFTSSLPKTRSGKIMRRLLRDIASGKADIAGDTSTLEAGA